MKAYRIYSGRKQDALELIEHTVSNPTAREVRVRVRAVSLNYRDLMIGWGQYPIPSDPPPIAVADGAGEVIAIGPQVTRFKVGDHVAIPYYPDWIDGEPTPESVHRVPGATLDGMLGGSLTRPPKPAPVAPPPSVKKTLPAPAPKPPAAVEPVAPPSPPPKPPEAVAPPRASGAVAPDLDDARIAARVCNLALVQEKLPDVFNRGALRRLPTDVGERLAALGLSQQETYDVLKWWRGMPAYRAEVQRRRAVEEYRRGRLDDDERVARRAEALAVLRAACPVAFDIDRPVLLKIRIAADIEERFGMLFETTKDVLVWWKSRPAYRALGDNGTRHDLDGQPVKGDCHIPPAADAVLNAGRGAGGGAGRP